MKTTCALASFLILALADDAEQQGYLPTLARAGDANCAIENATNDTLDTTVDLRVLGGGVQVGRNAGSYVAGRIPALELARLGLPDGGVLLGQEVEALHNELKRRAINYRWHYKLGVTQFDIPGSLSDDRDIRRLKVWGIDRVYRIKLYYSDNTRVNESRQAVPHPRHDPKLDDLALSLREKLSRSFRLNPESRVPETRRYVETSPENVVISGSFTTWGCQVTSTLFDGNYSLEVPDGDPWGRELSLTYSYLPLSRPAEVYIEETQREVEGIARRRTQEGEAARRTAQFHEAQCGGAGSASNRCSSASPDQHSETEHDLPGHTRR